MSEKYNKTCKCLNYHEYLFILASTSTGCVSISTFSSLICLAAGIKSPAAGINICAVTAVIKECKSIIKKMKKMHDKIVLLGNDTQKGKTKTINHENF